MLKRIAGIALIATGLVACGGDDDGTNVVPEHELVGTWISSGANVAPGLVATLKTVQITATFNANNTYTVVAEDSAGAEVTFTGTWAAPTGTNGSIRAITLNQATPAALTSTGIFQVTTGATTTMQYEVIQTTPAIAGFAAPTVGGGFGSTSYGGVALGATWTQGYVKQ